MPKEPLVVEEQDGPKEGQRIIRLTGPVLISNFFDFQAKVRASQSPHLIIDFTNVPFIDSAGIGALVGAYVTHQKDGRTLGLAGVNDRLRNALKVTHVESFFKFYDSVEAAAA